MLGEITIDDVPEIRQRSVQWMVNRYGPAAPTRNPVDLLEHLMHELERAWRKRQDCQEKQERERSP